MLIVNHSSTELEKENSYSFHAAVLSTLTASLAVSDPLESSWVWALKWTKTTSASSNLHHPYFIPTPSLPTPTSQQGALSVPSHFLCIHLASSLPGEKSKNLKAQEMRFHKDKQTTCATLVLLEWSEVLESPSQVHMFQAQYMHWALESGCFCPNFQGLLCWEATFTRTLSSPSLLGSRRQLPCEWFQFRWTVLQSENWSHFFKTWFYCQVKRC